MPALAAPCRAAAWPGFGARAGPARCMLLCSWAAPHSQLLIGLPTRAARTHRLLPPKHGPPTAGHALLLRSCTCMPRSAPCVAPPPPVRARLAPRIVERSRDGGRHLGVAGEVGHRRVRRLRRSGSGSRGAATGQSHGKGERAGAPPLLIPIVSPNKIYIPVNMLLEGHRRLVKSPCDPIDS